MGHFRLCVTFCLTSGIAGISEDCSDCIGQKTLKGTDGKELSDQLMWDSSSEMMYNWLL